MTPRVPLLGTGIGTCDRTFDTIKTLILHSNAALGVAYASSRATFAANRRSRLSPAVLLGSRVSRASSSRLIQQRGDIRAGGGAYEPPGERREISFMEDPFASGAVQRYTTRIEHGDDILGSAASEAFGGPLLLALGAVLRPGRFEHGVALGEARTCSPSCRIRRTWCCRRSRRPGSGRPGAIRPRRPELLSGSWGVIVSRIWRTR